MGASKNDLMVIMQIAISLIDKGEPQKAKGVLTKTLTGEFNRS